MALNKLIQYLKRIQAVIDKFFLPHTTDYEVKVKTRLLLYMCLISLAYLLVVLTIVEHGKHFSSKIVITTLFMLSRIIAIKYKKTSHLIFLILEVIFWCAFPVMSSNKTEESIRTVLIVVNLPTFAYLFVVPPKYIFPITVFGISFILGIRNKSLDLFRSNNYDLQIEIVDRLFGTACVYCFTNYLFVVFHSAQYREIIDDHLKAIAELKIINKKYEETCDSLQIANTALESTNKKLEEALKAKDTLLASVSHELRNPLNVMIGNIDCAMDESISKKAEEWLNTAKINGNMLVNLINNFLDASKIAFNKLELSYTPTNMYRFFEKVWKINSNQIKQKKLKGYLHIEKNFPKFLMIDTQRIMQIIYNLMANATKFTEYGQVRVIVTWVNDKIPERLIGEEHEFINSDQQSKLNTRKFQTSKAIKTHFNPEKKEETFKVERNPQKVTSITKYRTMGSIVIPDSKGLENFFFDEIIEAKPNNPSIKGVSPYFFQFNTDENFIKFCLNDDDNINNKLDEHVEERKGNDMRKGYLKIEVKDTGCGISHNVQDKIFQPFILEDSSNTRKHGGAGLGLFISKKLISKMSGKIQFVSKKDFGSEFVVAIPAISPPQSKLHIDTDFTKSKALAQKDVKLSFKGHKALVIDDNEYNLLIMKKFLEAVNIEVTTANNGQHGYDRYIEKKPKYFSFITMDLQMPVVDGLTSSKMIREFEKAQGITSHIPIVIVSGNCIEAERNLCLDPNGDIRATYFYRKPVSMNECHGFISNILLE